MAKKKGFWRHLAAFLKSIFGFFIKAITLLGKGLRWIATKAHGLVSKGAKKAGRIAANGRRPKSAAAFESFSEVESLNGKVDDFEAELYSGKSLIGLVLGARGSGKTAIGVRILENMRAKAGMRAYSMGLRGESVPEWVQPVESLGEVKNHSFILVDEGGIEFSSRSSMSDANKLLSELLLISRHKDISVLFITQNSANIEVNTLRQVDYILLKAPSLLQLDFERKKISEIYEGAKSGFAKHKGDPGLTYVFGHSYRGFVASGLPSFWSTRLSKSYAKKGSRGR